MGCVCMPMRVRVYEKRKKERQRRRERGKIKPRFLLSHFQLCEVRATLQHSIELNFNPASSYTHLLYCAVKAVHPNFHQRHYRQSQPIAKSRRRTDARRFHKAMSKTVLVEPPREAIISSRARGEKRMMQKVVRMLYKTLVGCVIRCPP